MDFKPKTGKMNDQIRHYENKLKYEMDPADLFEALQASEKITVIDTRKKHAYEAEHIPGAVSFPHREMNESSTAALDKSILYITYCDGIGCNASTKGALNLSKLGFRVKELIGGIDWWKRDGYATEGNNAQGGSKIECAC